jgi:carboxymethylenebutenolidase
MANAPASWVSVSLSANETMDGYLALPPGGKKGLGVVMLQEIFGVNAAMRAKAEDLASAGFVVLVPDLFWRAERRVDLAYTESDRQRGFDLMKRFDMQAGISDAVAAARWLTAHPACRGRVGFVGFCLGGKVAALAGARHPDTAAVVSFYGVKLDDNLAELTSLRAPFQFHVGDKDTHVPLSTVEKLRAALAGRREAEIHVYANAQHGFFNRLRADVYNPTAANLAKARMLALLERAGRAAAA